MKNKNNKKSKYQSKNKIEIYIDVTPPISIVVISFQLEVSHILNVLSHEQESRYLPFLIIIQSIIYTNMRKWNKEMRIFYSIFMSS